MVYPSLQKYLCIGKRDTLEHAKRVPVLNGRHQRLKSVNTLQLTRLERNQNLKYSHAIVYSRNTSIFFISCILQSFFLEKGL